MEFYQCGKCSMMVAEKAKQVHDELNHPIRQPSAESIAALARAREVLAQKRQARQEQAVQLDAAWEGRVA